MEITSRQVRFLARMGSRGAFGDAIYQLAKQNKDFFALSADLGHASGYDRLIRDYPEKYINVGIAEQNLVGVSAGLAKGKTPVFATTYAPFASFRCADQVRNYLGYMKLNVKIVGLDSGMIQAKFGASHYGLEDMTLMRAIPNVTVISPSDGVQIALAVEKILDYDGPVYLRLTGGGSLPSIYNENNARFEIGKANILKKKGKIAFIAVGSILHTVIQVCNELEKEGIESTIIDMHTIKPLDNKCLDELVDYQWIFTVEEHSIKGGLGSAVAEYYADKKVKPRQVMMGVEDIFPHPGSYDYLLKECKLDKESIINRIKKYL
jgi:transketolase